MSPKKMDQTNRTSIENEENIDSHVQFAYEQSGELTDLTMKREPMERSRQYKKTPLKQQRNEFTEG